MSRQFSCQLTGLAQMNYCHNSTTIIVKG